MLEEAQGRSEFVVTVFADIRGFSEFSKTSQAPNIAMYVKRLYLEMLDNYFATAAYAKPTGDGLLLIFPYGDKNLPAVCQTVVESCLRCEEEFGRIGQNDPMLNFALPKAVGFGIARGSACCLYSGKQIVDYSGHLLNLAARLNDIARPSGVVIDGNFGLEVLSDEQRQKFISDRVYMRGVAEEQATEILVQRGRVVVSQRCKVPLREEQWIEQRRTFTKSQLQKIVGNWSEELEYPAAQSQIKVQLSYVNPKEPGFSVVMGVVGWSYAAKPKPTIRIPGKVLAELVPKTVKKDDNVSLEVSYVRAPV